VSSRLEELLPGFRPKLPEEHRIQFGALDDQWFMVSFTTVPEIDAESVGIADRSGRATLAHAILVRREHMRSIGFDPFRIIDEVDWITNFWVLIERFKHTDGDVPSVVIRPRKRQPSPPRTASPEEARNIEKLVASAPDLIARRETIDIEASPWEAADWLQLVFYHAAQNAEFCSFSTSFDPHDQPRGKWWAVARPQVGEGTNIRYYPAERRLITTLPGGLDGLRGQ
jgi:hypothetical protein